MRKLLLAALAAVLNLAAALPVAAQGIWTPCAPDGAAVWRTPDGICPAGVAVDTAALEEANGVLGITPGILPALGDRRLAKLGPIVWADWLPAQGAGCTEGESGFFAAVRPAMGKVTIFTAFPRCEAPTPQSVAAVETTVLPEPPGEMFGPPLPDPRRITTPAKLAELEAEAKAALERSEARKAELAATKARLAEVEAQLKVALDRATAAEARIVTLEADLTAANSAREMAIGARAAAETALAQCQAEKQLVVWEPPMCHSLRPQSRPVPKVEQEPPMAVNVTPRHTPKRAPPPKKRVECIVKGDVKEVGAIIGAKKTEGCH